MLILWFAYLSLWLRIYSIHFEYYSVNCTVYFAPRFETFCLNHKYNVLLF